MHSDRYSCRCREHFRNALNVPSNQTPLWLPEPSSTLPKVFQRQGIAVGDVGIIMASGGFDFLFNVHRHTEFRPNSHLASASVHTLESPPALCRTHRLAKSIDSSADIYLNTYIPASNQWEQHMISSVRLVDRQQQLLYKVWQSLVEGQSESKCCSLHDELELQHRGARFHPSPSNDTQSPLRSTSTASVSPLSKAINEGKGFLTRSEAPRGEEQENSGCSPKVHNGTSTMVSSPVILASPASFGGAQSTQTTSDTHNSLLDYLMVPPAPAPLMPYHPHPPLKCWPNDYTVWELSQGFHFMDLLIALSPSGTSMTQRMAFEHMFGSRYIKSTVCRHCAIWRNAPHALREQFELMGSDDHAYWGEFVRRVENWPSAKNQNNVELMATLTSSNMGYHEKQSLPEVEESHGAESVINSLQNQGLFGFSSCLISLLKCVFYLVTSTGNSSVIQSSEISLSIVFNNLTHQQA